MLSRVAMVAWAIVWSATIFTACDSSDGGDNGAIDAVDASDHVSLDASDNGAIDGFDATDAAGQGDQGEDAQDAQDAQDGSCTDGERRCTDSAPQECTSGFWVNQAPCATGQACASGTCVCIPDCTDLECGSDGCGESCGTCTDGESCLASGQCGCEPAAETACQDGDVWSFDSCGVAESLITSCEGDGCEDGACLSEVCTPAASTACQDGDVWSFDSCGVAESVATACGVAGCEDAECGTCETCSGTLCPPVSVGATRFVSASEGDDDAAEGLCVPFATITAALASATAGDVVWVAPGTYTAAKGETFPLVVPSGVTLTGDPASQGAGAEPTLVTGHGLEQQSGSAVPVTAVIELQGAKDVVIEGLWLKSTWDGTPTDSGDAQNLDRVMRLEDPDGVTIRGNTFEGLTSGILVKGAGTAILALNAFDHDERPSLWGTFDGELAVEDSTFDESASLDLAMASGGLTFSGNTVASTNRTLRFTNSGSDDAIVIVDNVFNSQGPFEAVALAGAGPIHVRSNHFEVATGSAVMSTGTGLRDLGSASIPGANTFNTASGPGIETHSTGSFTAIGNTSWAGEATPVCGTHIVVHPGAAPVTWGTLSSQVCSAE